MALKCVTCGLLFRNRNELDWHVREEHLERGFRRRTIGRRRPRLRQASAFPLRPVPEEKAHG